MPPSKTEASRHIAQEARVVLTSLRAGPPAVARGELAQDLVRLRERLVDLGELEMPLVARPFLQVIMDPRAAGPYTLASLRAVKRMLQAGTLQVFQPSLEDVTVSVLGCKFEQTDAGADEAVEMAIADVLLQLIRADVHNSIGEETVMEAFNTVFVTRNTFVHSPALCYHFEDVLTEIVVTAFSSEKASHIQRLLFEFLVSQLLHTPLVGGDGLDDSTREAQMAHDGTRIVCLRLARAAIQTNPTLSPDLLPLIQDDLCLSLLMTGQAVWAYHDIDTSPGFVSLEVLTEICATFSLLWNKLRTELLAQFETIFTGFYTRGLMLLRKRRHPVNSSSFHANLIFDAEVEIILESLVDILALHDHSHSITTGDGGSLESLFACYDCHLHRSDVAAGLMMELCRCCGGTVDEEGHAVISRQSSNSDQHSESTDEAVESTVRVDHPSRQVPAHLKELCAQAVMGGMKCLFRDDSPSAETMLERSNRKKSIMLRHVVLEDDDENCVAEDHVLRDLKSKKRLMRKAARIFNQKTSRGIEFLLDAGLLPSPVTPASVAMFLRTAIVVGLDKKAVGMYLGDAGKSPVAGKSPPDWERDWFHKDVLKFYCQSFRFEGQSLLDGLRMFLAAFRLPGEAQQIDRILQAFADTCVQVCEESRLKIFSEDPKRASDAAYLLSFSIIMLNTDQHNSNIRQDRKMSIDDFVRNNMDYGRDITEKGKELPREYLEGIYNSIREEEIRTEGEGADGAMTVERWKDVLRSAEDNYKTGICPSSHDAEDLTELVLEHVWKPIMSAIGALWGISRAMHDADNAFSPVAYPESVAHSGMLGVQGARLGMDMSLEMLRGVRQLGRIDIFRNMFHCICDYTGLLGDYDSDVVERTWELTNSVESQSAIIVVIMTALEAGEDLGDDGWKRLWAILLELRDLKLISKSYRRYSGSLLSESDRDLLSDSARRDWIMCLMKGDMEYNCTARPNKAKSGSRGVFGVFGRALFGTDPVVTEEDRAERKSPVVEKSLHGKEDAVIWDEFAPSDDESDESDDDDAVLKEAVEELHSEGLKFENQLIRESIALSNRVDMPVTGLERVEETRKYQVSPRARVRERFRKACNIRAVISESRFLDDDALRAQSRTLVELSSFSAIQPKIVDIPPQLPSHSGHLRERSPSSDLSSSSASFTFGPSWRVPVSPASEALAEVLICELALKNKDRLKLLWNEVLQDHYMSRLASILVNPADGNNKIPVDPGLEKRVTGLLRLGIFSVQREDLINDILSTWKYVLPITADQRAISPLRALDKHLGEGLWRIVTQVDGLGNLDESGWEGLIALFNWCANRGCALKPLDSSEIHVQSGLPEDDAAIQTYRSLHLIVNSDEISDTIPCTIVESLRLIAASGHRRRYPQLTIASLDLLHTLYEKRVIKWQDADDCVWTTCWKKIVEGIAEAADNSTDLSVRQHALSMLTDIFLDKQGNTVPMTHLCCALSDICIPLAGRCIVRLQLGGAASASADELMIEFELCIGLIFKPLRHHLDKFLSHDPSLSLIWKSVLRVVEDVLLCEPEEHKLPGSLRSMMEALANEHLRNAITVLISANALTAESTLPGDLSAATWESVKRMGIDENSVEGWKQQAKTILS